MRGRSLKPVTNKTRESYSNETEDIYTIALMYQETLNKCPLYENVPVNQIFQCINIFRGAILHTH